MTTVQTEFAPNLDTMSAARRDMCTAYAGGAAGALVSGMVWVIAGGVAAWISPQHAVWALFIGGMCIHPVAVLCLRLFGRTGRHAANNPLAPLAMATTIWMIMMLPLAYGVSLFRIDLFFPAMLFVIAGRYLCFHTLYGSRLYWVFGGVLALAGYGLAQLHAPVELSALTGGLIEILFAGLLWAGDLKRSGRSEPSTNKAVV